MQRIQKAINSFMRKTKTSETVVSETTMEDPIITELFKNRQSMTDVSAEHELERRKRMYNMVRHSSHYKGLQVKRANDMTKTQGGLLDLSEIKMASSKRISFADDVTIIN
jgi:hypothetical protein